MAVPLLDGAATFPLGVATDVFAVPVAGCRLRAWLAGFDPADADATVAVAMLAVVIVPWVDEVTAAALFWLVPLWLVPPQAASAVAAKAISKPTAERAERNRATADRHRGSLFQLGIAL
jgi:hypothetical protein